MRRVFGTLLIVVGIVGVVGAPIGASRARSALNELSAELYLGLEVGASGLTALEVSIAAASATLQQAADSMDQISTTVLVAGASIDDSQDVLNQVAAISGEELPSAIDSFRDSMPALIKVASAIDSTLRAVAFLTPGQYDPDVPFDEAIVAIDASLAEMRPALVSQAELIEEAASGVDGVTSQLSNTTVELNKLRDSMRVSAGVLDGNVAAISSAQLLIGDIGVEAEAQAAVMGGILFVVGLLFAVSQLAVLVVGVAVWRGELLAPSNGDSNESESDS
jgi:hypothetical protein